MNFYSKPFYFTMFIASLLVALLVRFNREKYYGTSESIDFLLGSAPSFFYLFGLLMLITIFSKAQKYSKFLQYAVFVSLGALAYELEQYWTERTFDIADIAASILATVLYLCLHSRIFRKYRDNAHR
jgi:hypothetical protein